MRKTIIFLFLFFLSIIAVSCSSQEVAPEQSPLRVIETQAIQPQNVEIVYHNAMRVMAFEEQIHYFYSTKGRVPASYDEWLSSGFLVFTPWSGNALTPVSHTDRELNIETDPVGSFHYQKVDKATYRLELIYPLESTPKLLTYTTDMDETSLKPLSYVKRGQTYLEAKVDLLRKLEGILWMKYRPDLNGRPGSLADVVTGYISLVPEGFSPLPTDAGTGSFEFGWDFGNGGQHYSLSDIQNSKFKLGPAVMGYRETIEVSPNQITNDRFILFSSDLLKSGFPGLFN